MTEIKIREDEEYIKLGQALKKAGLVGSGVEAKMVVQDGLVKVNGEIDTRRGKKLVGGDTFEYNGTIVKVVD
jgi:ribosome-associated protein